MFTHTKEGRINDILRHSLHFNAFARLYRLLCVYYDNFHICRALYARNIGTNLYHCDRVLFFIFHALWIGFLSLFMILCYQNDALFMINAIHNEFIWMFIICLITLFIIELFSRCIGLSTPKRLEPETIELLYVICIFVLFVMHVFHFYMYVHTSQLLLYRVESESARIKAMRKRTKTAIQPRKSKKKLFDPEYWAKKYQIEEQKIKDIIHVDAESRELPVDVAKWSISDVGIWIHSLGLAKYQSEFEHEQIDGKKLLRLHLDDIKEYVPDKKDAQFLHSSLHSLKIKWRHRFVTLAKKRKASKNEAKRIQKQRREKKKREKLLQQVRIQSINHQIHQHRKSTDVDDEKKDDHHLSKRPSGLRATFRNISTIFGSKNDKSDDINHLAFHSAHFTHNYRNQYDKDNTGNNADTITIPKQHFEKRSTLRSLGDFLNWNKKTGNSKGGAVPIDTVSPGAKSISSPDTNQFGIDPIIMQSETADYDQHRAGNKYVKGRTYDYNIGTAGHRISNTSGNLKKQMSVNRLSTKRQTNRFQNLKLQLVQRFGKSFEDEVYIDNGGDDDDDDDDYKGNTFYQTKDFGRAQSALSTTNSTKKSLTPRGRVINPKRTESESTKNKRYFNKTTNFARHFSDSIRSTKSSSFRRHPTELNYTVDLNQITHYVNYFEQEDKIIPTMQYC